MVILNYKKLCVGYLIRWWIEGDGKKRELYFREWDEVYCFLKECGF